MISESTLPVTRACTALDVSSQTFYSWNKGGCSSDSDKDILSAIQRIAVEFTKYGYRRITKQLHRDKLIVNHKRVHRIMKANGLLVRRRKYKPVTTYSGHGLKVYPNHAKEIVITKPNRLWVADITYIYLPTGFAYLAAILDIFSRKCVGWSLSMNIDTTLALDALNMAIETRKQLGFTGLIHHSDRGVQYASRAYVERLKEEDIIISMSAQGNCYDNAFAESFNKTIKVEEVYINEYKTFDEAYTNIKKFIELVYNQKRLHSSIGYVPPNEFEQKALIEVSLN